MSGRGRKAPRTKGSPHRPQTPPKARSGSGSTASRGGTTARVSAPEAADTRPLPPAPARRSPAPAAHRPGGRVDRAPAAARRPSAPPRDRAKRRRRNTRIGVLVAAGALAATLIGSALGGQPTRTDTAAQDAGAGSGRAPASRPVAGPAIAAGAGTATARAQQTSAVPAPALAISCLPANGGAAVFGHDITAPTPYTVAIDYGDGDKYADDSAHLSAVFSHTYALPGTYAVTAVLTAPGGATAVSSCRHTWAAAPAAARATAAKSPAPESPAPESPAAKSTAAKSTAARSTAATTTARRSSAAPTSG